MVGRNNMEQIETQASDLRYLAQAPVALSDTASVSYDTPRPGPHASPSGSASYGDNSAAVAAVSASNANKRKSIDDGSAAQKQTRSKRNRVSFEHLFAPARMCRARGRGCVGSFWRVTRIRTQFAGGVDVCLVFCDT